MSADISQDDVRRALKQLGGRARVREIGARVGSSANISKKLSQLAKWGLVVKVAHGVYILPRNA
jgi:DNA-binding HxlR family transcriptional regulator